MQGFKGPGKLGSNFAQMAISHGLRHGMTGPMSTGMGMRPRLKGFEAGGGIARRAFGGPMGPMGIAAPISPAMPGMMARGMAQSPLGNFRQTETVADSGQGRMFPGNTFHQFADGGEVKEPPKLDSGFLHGETAGRDDKVISASPSGSYIIPADIVSGLGEGNSLSGAKVLDEILRKLEADSPKRGSAPQKATGVPVALSHGEYQISPRHVAMIGKGDMKRGHAILDRWVQSERAKHIKTLKRLKPPIGAKKA